MKKFLPVILAFFCAPAVAQQLPRIAIAGLGIESSTFSPARTEEPALHARYGAEIFGYYPFLKEETAPLRQQAHWLPAVIGKSLPGGVDQDLHRLPYKRINRPMFPLDKNMKTPDLSVRRIRAADALK